MQPIFLIGYMGSGKTTLGAALATEMQLQFIDLDDYIEERCNATIREIFATVGEKRFREIETEALRQVCQMQDTIVACGGGTPCQKGNMEIINDNGLSIWLTTSPERIALRLCLPEQKAKRPLIASMADEEILANVRRVLAEREPYYSQAQLRFDSTDIETAEATTATAKKLAALLTEVLQ